MHQNYCEYHYRESQRHSKLSTWRRLAQLAGRPHKLTWPRTWSSKRVCWDFRDIRDKNAVNWVSWGKKGQFLASNIRSVTQVTSYESVFPEDQGLKTEDWGPRTEDLGVKTEDWGPRNEDSLRPTEDTLADLLVLINSVGPHKPLVSLEQLVSACHKFTCSKK